ncbi:MAG: isopentenyl-diphosphate Delta-isomerase [Planktomarina sp.]
MTTDILIPAWVDGTLTPVEKLETHLRGLRHQAVSVFVMLGDMTLLQRRDLGKYHTPGLWANTCCTHPEWGEAAHDCALRRLDQELGINGLNPIYRDTVEYRADVGGGMIEHEVVDIFVADAEPGLVIKPNPQEVMDVRWISVDDLKSEVASKPEIFTPWLKIYLDQHSSTIFGDQVG